MSVSVRAMLQQASGLDLSQVTVDRALRERMRKVGIEDRKQYLHQLGAHETAALIELVVVPESWMFRDADAFAAATAAVQRRLAGGRVTPVRILSVPCAGGEEPYSMAMALVDAGLAPQSFRIDAMDLSAVAIERARTGRYTRNAFRGQELSFRERHFVAVDDEYLLSESIRAQVCFSQGNLLAFDTASAACSYDIIFCRNLLIYFDEPTTAAAIANLRTLLADDGVLFAGYAEVPAFCRHGFAALRLPGAFALQKAAPGAAPFVTAATGAPFGTTPARPAPAAAAAPHTKRALVARPAPADPRAPVATRLARAGTATLVAPTDAAAAGDSAALLAQARRQADQGELAAASASCKAALAQDGQLGDAYFILGLVSVCSGDNAAAGQFWRRCVYLQPDHYEALCHLALLAEDSGEAAQAALLRQRAARIYQRAHERVKATS
jgi:chemotaxis protein methyltransferase WspC